jgi:hypothetical protein
MLSEEVFVWDDDGLLIPAMWAATKQGRKNWDGFPFEFRKTRSQEYTDRISTPPKKPKAKRPPVKRFTTQAAVDWGKKRGWTLIDREAYNFRTKRHHDTMIASDAIFEGPEGLILVQGAGRYEREKHWEKFVARGGKEACERRKIALFFYLEFVRGQEAPILIEEWTA